jgi:hypothetical protein
MSLRSGLVCLFVFSALLSIVLLTSNQTKVRLLTVTELDTVARGGSPGPNCYNTIVGYCQDWNRTCFDRQQSDCPGNNCYACSGSSYHEYCRLDSRYLGFYATCQQRLERGGCGYTYRSGNLCRWNAKNLYCECVIDTVMTSDPCDKTFVVTTPCTSDS